MNLGGARVLKSQIDAHTHLHAPRTHHPLLSRPSSPTFTEPPERGNVLSAYSGASITQLAIPDKQPDCRSVRPDAAS